MARLVIIDDEGHISEILTRYFREKNHEVFGTTSAEEALVYLQENPADLVITDIAMQGLSGLELLQKMRELQIEVPVIVTTGNPSHGSAVQALRSGAFDYVVKPFHLEEISERAEKALATKRVKDENLLYSKLVSLHSITKVTAEATSVEDLATKVIKLGARLTGSESGWYWVKGRNYGQGLVQNTSLEQETFYPAVYDDEEKLLLVELAYSAVKAGELIVVESPSLSLQPAWYLALPVEMGKVLHGVLIFERSKSKTKNDVSKTKYDAVDMEVFNQMAATFALGIRALSAGLPDF